MTQPWRRRLVAESVGTGFLLVAVVGSGIMAQRLSSDGGLQLLENAVATGAALAVLILVFAPISGAHFNPVVTLAAVVDGAITRIDAIWFVLAQVVGAGVGTLVANVMFDHRALEWSTTIRSSGRLWLSEVVATLGLLLVTLGLSRSHRASFIPIAVGAWITGAYWFTSSTSFANPAVTFGRMLTNSFSGIRPSSAPMFVVMQLIGTALAIGLVRVLYPQEPVSA